MVELTNGQTDVRARTLKDAFQLCDAGPLEDEALKRYYVELSAVRSEEAMGSVGTRLSFFSPGSFGSVLFTGAHPSDGGDLPIRKKG